MSRVFILKNESIIIPTFLDWLLHGGFTSFDSCTVFKSSHIPDAASIATNFIVVGPTPYFAGKFAILGLPQ